MSTGRRQEQSGGFDRIEPVAVIPGSPRRVKRRSPTGSPILRRMILVALLGATVGVLLWQPAAPVGRRAASVPEVETPRPPADVERILALGEEARSLAGALDERRRQVEARAVGRWDPVGKETLSMAAGRAGTELAGRDFEAAILAHREAIGIADRLLAASERVLTDSLERGREALAAFDAAAAADAFALALAIAPGDPAARSGSRRAASLEELRRRLRSGEERERAGDLDGALVEYRRALELDKESAGARQGVERVGAARARRDFGREMSKGLAALDRGDPVVAREAFRAAASLRPEAPEARDGLARAGTEIRSRRIAALFDRAAALEAAERWPEALTAHEEALALDGTLAFALAGRERAARRVDLSQRVEAYLAAPDRLAAREVREAASLLVEETRAAAPGPVLRGQMERLGALLDQARHPVSVVLRSDNETEVLLYHVGHLGRFDSREMRLTPGSYTAVGRRAGFRDVRRVFRVPASGPIVITCEEAI